jgi:hypothetical protein
MFAAKLKTHQQCGLVFGVAACFLAGCTSSSQMRRIDANRDIYEQWPIEMRQAVLDGNVAEGMTPEMVEMAIGKPTEISTRSGTPQTGDDEIWIYRTGGYEQDPTMMGPSAAYPGGYPPGYPGAYPGSTYPGSYPGGMYPSSGGVAISSGRGGGISIIPPSVGIGIGSGGATIGSGYPSAIGGYPGGYPGSGYPTMRTPVEEREVVFRNGVVYRADPPPEK